jgi:DNA-binding response OmpR family regulator
MGPRILIVDDNLDLQTILTEVLSSDYEVASAANGEDAVALAQSFQPDVVLLDYHLPGMDGVDTGLRIKNDASPRFVPILILTALMDEAAAGGILDTGCCDALMAKPTPLPTIRAKVDELLYSHSEIT